MILTIYVRSIFVGNITPDDDDEDIIEIALGDDKQEIWTEIKMPPELKAHRMSASKKVYYIILATQLRSVLSSQIYNWFLW